MTEPTNIHIDVTLKDSPFLNLICMQIQTLMEREGVEIVTNSGVFLNPSLSALTLLMDRKAYIRRKET